MEYITNRKTVQIIIENRKTKTNLDQNRKPLAKSDKRGSLRSIFSEEKLEKKQTTSNCISENPISAKTESETGQKPQTAIVTKAVSYKNRSKKWPTPQNRKPDAPIFTKDIVLIYYLIVFSQTKLKLKPTMTDI